MHAFSRRLLLLARRDMRNRPPGLAMFFLCLLLGVAVTASALGVGNALREGVTHNSRVLLGGDVELSRYHYKIAQVVQAFGIFNGTLSQTAEVPAMINAGGKRLMVELKGVDGPYPLYGKLQFEGRKARRQIFPRDDNSGQFGAAVEQRLLDTLGLKVGDVINIGYLDFQIRAVIKQEPDRMGSGWFGFGPRVMVNMTAFDKTGLAEPSRQVVYRYRIKLPKSTNIDEFYATMRQKFPWAKWITRDWRQPLPGIGTLLGHVHEFLSFSALTALVTAGIGIGSATASYIRRRQHTIAVLSCLGAPRNTVLAFFAFQLGSVALRAIVLGLLAGALGTALIVHWLNGIFLLRLPLLPDVLIFLLSGLLGIAVATAFATLPLFSAASVRAAQLFRNQPGTDPELPRSSLPYAIIAIAAVFLVLLTIAATGNMMLTVSYAFALGAGLAAFRILAAGLQYGSRWLAHRRIPMTLRMALLDIARPATTGIIVALGLSLSFTAFLVTTGNSVLHYLTDAMPAKAPSYFLFDLPASEVTNATNQYTPIEGVREVQSMPMLRGHLRRIGPDAVEKLQLPYHALSVVNAPLSVSYSYGEPKHVGRLLQGHWWAADYSGTPLASINSELAQNLGLKVGDKITLLVQDLEFEAEINNIRASELSSLALNFDIIVNAGTLTALNHSWMMAIYSDPAADRAVRRLNDFFYSSQAIADVRDLVARLTHLVNQAQLAVWISAGVTLICSLLVMLSATLASMQQRLYDGVILKVLGVSRRILNRIARLEFGVIALITSGAALLLGTAATRAISHVLLPEGFAFPFWLGPAMLFCATAVIIATGLITTRRVATARPLALLRNE